MSTLNTVSCLLGDVYVITGGNRKATQHYEHYLSELPQAYDAAQVRDKPNSLSAPECEAEEWRPYGF